MIWHSRVKNWKFPSPTGVTYYECHVVLTKEDWQNCFRPQQGLLIMNTNSKTIEFRIFRGFPSPTGVTYYESTKMSWMN